MPEINHCVLAVVELLIGEVSEKRFGELVAGAANYDILFGQCGEFERIVKKARL